MSTPTEDPIDAPGEGYQENCLSPLPFKDGVGFMTGPHEYTKTRADKFGCPIFTCHPGVKTIMVGDHAGMSHFFTESYEVLDRDGTPGFGCIRLQTEKYYDNNVAVFLKEGSHEQCRTYLDKVVEKRGTEVFEESCQTLLREGWIDLKDKPEIRLDGAAAGAAVQVMFKWLFDIDIAPGDGDRHLNYMENIFCFTSDVAVSEGLSKTLNVGLGMKDSGSVEYAKELKEKIKASKPFQELYLEAAKECNMESTDEQLAQLAVCVGFNAAGGVYGTFFPAIGVLATKPDLLERLREELKSFGEGSTEELNKLPLLDAMFFESQRFFGRPKQFHRIAKADTVIPTNDGRKVKVPEGARVTLCALTARLDGAVFTDPEKFNPDRYLEDASLKAKVFAFGPPQDAANPFGCLGGGPAGIARRLWKASLCSLVKMEGWKLDPVPVVDVDATTGLNPQEVMLKWD